MYILTTSFFSRWFGDHTA